MHFFWLLACILGLWPSAVKADARPCTTSVENTLLLSKKMRDSQIEEAQKELLRIKAANDWDRLGVQRDASLDEIKSAFRNQSRKYHPDNLGQNPRPILKKIYEDIFNLTMESYQRLQSEDGRIVSQDGGNKRSRREKVDPKQVELLAEKLHAKYRERLTKLLSNSQEPLIISELIKQFDFGIEGQAPDPRVFQAARRQAVNRLLSELNINRLDFRQAYHIFQLLSLFKTLGNELPVIKTRLKEVSDLVYDTPKSAEDLIWNLALYAELVPADKQGRRDHLSRLLREMAENSGRTEQEIAWKTLLAALEKYSGLSESDTYLSDNLISLASTGLTEKEKIKRTQDLILRYPHDRQLVRSLVSNIKNDDDRIKNFGIKFLQLHDFPVSFSARVRNLGRKNEFFERWEEALSMQKFEMDETQVAGHTFRSPSEEFEKIASMKFNSLVQWLEQEYPVKVVVLDRGLDLDQGPQWHQIYDNFMSSNELNGVFIPTNLNKTLDDEDRPFQDKDVIVVYQDELQTLQHEAGHLFVYHQALPTSGEHPMNVSFSGLRPYVETIESKDSPLWDRSSSSLDQLHGEDFLTYLYYNIFSAQIALERYRIESLVRTAQLQSASSSNLLTQIRNIESEKKFLKEHLHKAVLSLSRRLSQYSDRMNDEEIRIYSATIDHLNELYRNLDAKAKDISYLGPVDLIPRQEGQAETRLLLDASPP